MTCEVPVSQEVIDRSSDIENFYYQNRKTTSQPNILVIKSHDQGRKLGGDFPNISTIKQMRDEGVIFSNENCTSPQCSPSRAAFLTGQTASGKETEEGLGGHRVYGLGHMGFPMNPSVVEKALPREMVKNGYYGFYVGIRGAHVVEDASELGFHRVRQLQKSFTHLAAPEIEEAIKTSPKNIPFFGYCTLQLGHRPFEEELLARFGTVPLTQSDIEMTSIPDDLRVSLDDILIEEEDWMIVKRDIALSNLHMALYNQFVDQVLSILDQEKMLEDTLLLLTTDHGSADWRGKTLLTEAGMGVKSIWHGPDFKGGKQVLALTSNLDDAPTILHACNIKVPEEMQGHNLAPLVKGEEKIVGQEYSLYKELYGEMSYHTLYDPQRSIYSRIGNTWYKLWVSYIPDMPFHPAAHFDGTRGKDEEPIKELLYRRGAFNKMKKPRPHLQLYNLTDDCYEENNLVGDPASQDILSTMAIKLNERLVQTEDPIIKGGIIPPEGILFKNIDDYNSE
ncbi:MAG TPA: sulfatase-like hydrolase/transferase [Candidatus Saccharimonadales bacterium]|nr:sulfatase-like hydrolase/transferase [Candidatus Saccharimonadales bacterium]